MTFIGLILVALAALLGGWRPTLLQMFLPLRAVAVGAAALGATLCTVSAFRCSSRRSAHVGWVLGSALTALLVQHDYRAYRERTVSFDSDGTRLAGTLYLPRSPGRYPGLVIVHGSGRMPRRAYHVWADHWVRRGVAVLLYDKRGCGDSGGVYEGENNTSRANIERLARDAAAALATLGSRAEVLPGAVGFWGVSQAGWIIPRAAAIERRAAFMILVSGPTVTVGEENAYSRAAGDGFSAARATVEEAERQMIAAGRRGFDPMPDLAELQLPGLWLQGELDGSSPPHRSAKLLEDLRAAGKPYEIRTFPDAGHAIFLPHRWSRPLPELAPGYWEVQHEWLTRVLGAGCSEARVQSSASAPPCRTP